jgi:hypothetical protein
MSFLHLVNQALLPDRPQVMPQVLLFLQQERYLDAAQLLQQHTLLPRSDAEDFIAHHVQGGVMSASLISGPLLTAVHKAMRRGDTKHALYLLQAAQGKAIGVKVAEPESLPMRLMKGILLTLLVYAAMVVAFAISLFIFIRHIFSTGW